MFSPWDFNGWIVSIGIALFMVVLLAGFGALVNALLARIWGEERDVASTPRMSSAAKEPPIRKAA